MLRNDPILLLISISFDLGLFLLIVLSLILISINGLHDKISYFGFVANASALSKKKLNVINYSTILINFIRVHNCVIMQFPVIFKA